MRVVQFMGSSYLGYRLKSHLSIRSHSATAERTPEDDLEYRKHSQHTAKR